MYSQEIEFNSDEWFLLDAYCNAQCIYINIRSFVTLSARDDTIANYCFQGQMKNEINYILIDQRSQNASAHFGLRFELERQSWNKLNILFTIFVFTEQNFYPMHRFIDCKQ